MFYPSVSGIFAVFQFIPAIRRVSSRLPSLGICANSSFVSKEGRDFTSHQWLPGSRILVTLDSLRSNCSPTRVSEILSNIKISSINNNDSAGSALVEN